MTYVEVRQPGTGHLLFRYDPARKLVEIKAKGGVTVVDLEGIPPMRLPVVRTPLPPAANNAAAQANPSPSAKNADGEGQESTKETIGDGQGEDGQKIVQPELIEGGDSPSPKPLPGGERSNESPLPPFTKGDKNNPSLTPGGKQPGQALPIKSDGEGDENKEKTE